LVVAVGVAVFMATLDRSIVAVALPVIEREFHTPTSTTQWVVLGYLLPLIALALPSGRWLDRVGRRAALTFAVTGLRLAIAGADALLIATPDGQLRDRASGAASPISSATCSERWGWSARQSDAQAWGRQA
jgi:MFS family permease